MKKLSFGEESGLELSEYAIAAALIVLFGVTVFGMLGTAIQDLFILMTTVING